MSASAPSFAKASFVFLADAKVPLVTLALGECGLPTRVLAPIYGAVMTFGALQRGVPGVLHQSCTFAVLSSVV